MSSEQSNNLLLLNPSSLSATNSRLSSKHVRFTEHQHHIDGALQRFENLYGPKTTSDHCASYVWSVNLRFFSYVCVYVSWKEQSVDADHQFLSSSQVATIYIKRTSDGDWLWDVNIFFRHRIRLVSLQKVSLRHWACMHTYKYVLATRDPIISLVRRNDRNPYCVCVTLLLLQMRDDQKNKLTISFAFSSNHPISQSKWQSLLLLLLIGLQKKN